MLQLKAIKHSVKKIIPDYEQSRLTLIKQRYKLQFVTIY